MANSKPFVAAALICERILEEADGVLSAIRIVDTYQTKLVRVGPPAEAPNAANTLDATEHLEMSALVILKAGAIEGHHEMALALRDPDGKRTEFPQKFPINFAMKDPAEGAQAKVRFVMGGKSQSGLYWLDVLWDGELLTSIPIKLLRTVDEAAKK